MNNNILPLSILIMALPCVAAEPSPAPAAAPTGSAVVPTQDNTGPRIAFDQTAYDFGKVESGELIKHTFFFTNTGNALLEVSDVRPSCGCTAAGAWATQVEPGKFRSIPVQVKS